MRDLDLLVGDGEIGFHLLVLGLDGLHRSAGLDDLVRKLAGMQAQLAVGREKLGLLLFQQPFGGEPQAPLLREFAGEIHACPPALPENFPR